MRTLRALLGLALALALCGAYGAESAAQQAKKEAAKRVDAARERCRANHGVDCDSEAGLKEWVLQERTRAEAVREGSRHRAAPR